MVRPRIMILRAPGTNCDGETAHAFERAGAVADVLHVNRLLDAPKLLSQYQVLCLPGGFSYGDDIAAGRILGNQIRHQLAAHFQDFKQAGKLILGICNGFQALMKSGVLLPENVDGTAPATLAWNASGKFEDRWISLYLATSKSVFFVGIDTMYLPVAHAEGRFVARGRESFERLNANGQLVLRYGLLTPGGAAPAFDEMTLYPDNPNGSMGDVAGLCDDTGRVCGLMPHPERFIEPTQHPRWTRDLPGTAGDGLRVFQNAVNYFR